MKNLFTITEQEKKQILKNHNLLKEATDIGCIEGACKNGDGTYVTKTTNKLGVSIETSEGKFGDVEGKLDGVGKKTVVDKYSIKLGDITEVYEGTFENGILVNGKRTTTASNVSIIESGTFENNKLNGAGSLEENNTAGKTKKVGDFEDGNLISGTIDYDTGDIKFKVESEKITYDENGRREIFDNPKITFPNGKIIEGTGALYKDTSFNTFRYFYKDGTTIDDFNQYVKDNQSGEVTSTSASITSITTQTPTKTSEGMPVITDEMRSKWKGCGATYSDEKMFRFDGGVGDSIDYGYLSEMPELGFAKFEGEIDGKSIKVNACFDKFKLMYSVGNETGDRGTFDGYYYSTDNQKPYVFEGDENQSNMFEWGTLKNSPEYSFHDDKWEYIGGFENGLMSDVDGEIIFEDLSKYVGSFVDGKISGQGKFSFPNGGIYEGKFEQSQGTNKTTIYKVTLNNGAVIDDLFSFHSKYKPTSEIDSDFSAGLIKSADIEGSILFKTEVSFPTEEGGTFKKTFQGGLPNAIIKLILKKSDIVEKDIEGDYFETTSNQESTFTFDDVPYGTYRLEATFGNVSDPYFSYYNDNLVIDSNKKYKITLSKTKKLEKLETENYKQQSLVGDYKDDTYDVKDYLKLFYDYMLEDQEYSDAWIKDLISGSFEEKYGKGSTLERCVDTFNTYATQIKMAYNKDVKKSSLKTDEEVESAKNVLTYCWSTYKEDLKKKINKDDLKLIQQPGGGDLYKYQVYLKENYNKQNIYIKQKNGMSETIKNIIKEHAIKKKKENIVESKIIKNRLNFILENQNFFNPKNVVKKNLLEERNVLIDNGYNSNIVNHIFNDLVNKI